MTKEDSTAPREPIARVQKNRREELRFTLDEFKGHRFVTVRIYAPNRDGTTMLPTRAGITFRPELISDVRVALEKIECEARVRGLLADG